MFVCASLSLSVKWFYDGIKLEIVNQYKYLGMTFSTGLTFSYAHENMAKPMLTYGSEVWGLIAKNRIIERIHLFAIKKLLNVSPRTPNALVYGETGRYPLYISTYTRCIKYWLNILRMQEDRIPLKSYKILYNMHCNNKTTGPPLFTSHCIDTDMDMFGKTRVFVI